MTLTDLFKELLKAGEKAGLGAEVLTADGNIVTRVTSRKDEVVLVTEEGEKSPQLELFGGDGNV